MNAAFLLSAVLAATNPAHGDTDSSSARTVVGAWRLSEVGGRVGCTLTLTDRQGAGGRDLEAPAACHRAFPPLKALTVWNLDARGEPVFSDTAKRQTVPFAGRLGGPYAATAPDGKAWRLVAASPKTTTAATP
jgi:hypothetical protein